MMKRVTRIDPIAPIVATIVVIGALIAVGAADIADSSSQPPPSTRTEKKISELLNGITQSGATLGQASAPITLQVFGDLESADVRTFVLWLLPDILREWVRTNIVKLQYRSFMTASSPYPNVFASQQAAALSAGAQDRLWNFIETFYHEQGEEDTHYVTEAYLESIARQIPGLNVSEWRIDRENSQLSKLVDEENRIAKAVGFPDAPLFLIGRTGGKLVPWPGYRLYEEPGLKRGFIKLPVHPVSFITSKTLKGVIEHLP